MFRNRQVIYATVWDLFRFRVCGASFAEDSVELISLTVAPPTAFFCECAPMLAEWVHRVLQKSSFRNRRTCKVSSWRCNSQSSQKCTREKLRASVQTNNYISYSFIYHHNYSR